MKISVSLLPCPCLVKITQVNRPPAGPGLRKGCVCGIRLGAEEPGRKPIHSLWREFSTDAGLIPLGPCAQPLCVIESSLPFSALTLTRLLQTRLPILPVSFA